MGGELGEVRVEMGVLAGARGGKEVCGGGGGGLGRGGRGRGVGC